MRYPGWLEKLRTAVAEFGPTVACAYVMHRALGRVGIGVYLYRFVAQPVRAQPWLPSTRGRTITVREVSRGEPELTHMPLDERVIEYRWAQNATCLGAFKDGRMIGYLWLSLGPYKEDEVRGNFVPAPHGRAAWDFDVYFLPDHRLGLGFMRLWDEANRLLRTRHIAWSISRISAFNRHSLATHAKLGALHVGSAMFLRAGPAQLTLASLRPRIHLSFSSSRVPQFVIEAPQGGPKPFATEAAAGKRRA